VFTAGLSYDGLSNADLTTAKSALCGVPYTLVHGTADTTVDPGPDANLANALQGCSGFKYVPVQGATHGTWNSPDWQGYGNGDQLINQTLAAARSGSGGSSTGSGGTSSTTGGTQNTTTSQGNGSTSTGTTSTNQTSTAPACAQSGVGAKPTMLATEVGDPPSSNGQSNYASFVSAMGQTPGGVDTYLLGDPSQFASSAAYSASSVKAANTNAIPIVGIPMATSQGSADSDFKAIVSGQWDSDLNGAFKAFADAGQKTIIIRPGWEMNGNWEPWSVNPGNAADFTAAFQHIANLAHSYSGMNIQVTWNPGYVTSATSYMSIFPGAQYVDSIGIDTYGAAGGTPDTAPLASTTDPNTFTLQDAIALAKSTGKPLSLPETGAGPGDTTFPSLLGQTIKASGVPVSYAVLWDDGSGGQSDLHWSDNAAAAAAWKQAFADISGNGGGSCGSSTILGDSTGYTPQTSTVTDNSGSGSYSPPTSTGGTSYPPSTHTTQTCAATTASGAAGGGFTTQNGQIIGPDGKPFIARGVNVMNGNGNPSAAQLQSAFPGVNFVRLAIYNYDSPASLSSYVNDLTSHGIVVELENHANSSGQNAGGGDQNGNQPFTGSQLANESAWYASVASAFKSNTNVWFGTNNEPAGTGAQISAWEQQTYQAIRSTGNNSPVMLEAGGTTASAYTGMSNVVWDQHYYGWLTNYCNGLSSDACQATVNQNLASTVAADKAVANIPVAIGEYGNSTTGVATDANGTQVVSAVQQSGLGSAAWAWGTGAPGDGLTSDSGSPSAYGQRVAAGFTSGSGATTGTQSASACSASAASSAQVQVVHTPQAQTTAPTPPEPPAPTLTEAPAPVLTDPPTPTLTTPPASQFSGPPIVPAYSPPQEPVVVSNPPIDTSVYSSATE
jgi:hypothetical protein